MKHYSKAAIETLKENRHSQGLIGKSDFIYRCQMRTSLYDESFSKEWERLMQNGHIVGTGYRGIAEIVSIPKNSPSPYTLKTTQILCKADKEFRRQSFLDTYVYHMSSLDEKKKDIDALEKESISQFEKLVRNNHIEKLKPGVYRVTKIILHDSIPADMLKSCQENISIRPWLFSCIG